MTEVMYQPTLNNSYQEPKITVGEQKLQAVEHFTYILSCSANIDNEVSTAFEILIRIV